LEAAQTAGTIADNISKGYLDNGVLGLTALLFMFGFAIMFYLNMKDKTAQDKTASAIESMADSQAKMVTNQTNFTEQYKTSQAHHKEVVALIIDDRKVERANTKECYGKVENRLGNHEKKLDDILAAVGA
jgi:predicted aminopeptidase